MPTSTPNQIDPESIKLWNKAALVADNVDEAMKQFMNDFNQAGGTQFLIKVKIWIQELQKKVNEGSDKKAIGTGGNKQMEADLKELQAEMEHMRRQIDDLLKLKDKMKNMPNDSDFQLLRNRLDEAEKADNRMGKNITDL